MIRLLSCQVFRRNLWGDSEIRKDGFHFNEKGCKHGQVAISTFILWDGKRSSLPENNVLFILCLHSPFLMWRTKHPLNSTCQSFSCEGCWSPSARSWGTEFCSAQHPDRRSALARWQSSPETSALCKEETTHSSLVPAACSTVCAVLSGL